MEPEKRAYGVVRHPDQQGETFVQADIKDEEYL